MTFKVIKPGPFTTIQDAGRLGQSHLGLTEGGPMDFRSFAIANRLVGNPIENAALEITLGGLSLQCNDTTYIALTGAFCPLLINGKPQPLWQSHKVKQGDIIDVGYAALGVRAYLSICGGFDSPLWFHSRSTVVRERLGKALQEGQILKWHNCDDEPNYKLDYQQQPSLRKKATLDFVPGYQWNDLSAEAQQTFLNSEFQVSAYSDRMGCQLDGPPIPTGIERIYSEGIAAGSIQVTGEGKPIILMRDRQTIGGYPKLGAITTESQSVLAQLQQGSVLKFNQISLPESVDRLRDFDSEIRNAKILELSPA